MTCTAHDRPAVRGNNAVTARAGLVDVFAYGVLMHAELLRALTGRRFATRRATLHAFQRYTLDKDGWPAIPVIVGEPGASVPGVLVLDVDDEALRLIDDFEDVEYGLYDKRSVEVVVESEQSSQALAYVAGREAMGCLAGVWSPERFVERHYREYLERIIPRFLAARES